MRHRGAFAALAVCLVVLPGAAVFAQGDEGADLGQLIGQLKEATRKRQALRAPWDEILAFKGRVIPYAVPMLGAPENFERIAGARLLAQVAIETDDKRAKEPLQRATRDSSPAVAYWGYFGLLQSKLLEGDDLTRLVVKALGPDQPPPVRALGCKASGARKVKRAVGWLVAILQENRQGYREAKSKVFVEEVRVRAPTPAAAPTGGGQGGEPGFGEGGTADRPRETVTRAIVRPINLKKTRSNIIRKKGVELERAPVVRTIRTAGVALEQVTGEKFGFQDDCSWELRDCSRKAIGWYERNKSLYPGGPGAPAVEEPKVAPETPKKRVGPTGAKPTRRTPAARKPGRTRRGR